MYRKFSSALIKIQQKHKLYIQQSHLSPRQFGIGLSLLRRKVLVAKRLRFPRTGVGDASSAWKQRPISLWNAVWQGSALASGTAFGSPRTLGKDMRAVIVYRNTQQAFRILLFFSFFFLPFHLLSKASCFDLLLEAAILISQSEPLYTVCSSPVLPYWAGNWFSISWW